MTKYTYLTPGPAEPYFTYDYHLKKAVSKGIPSISHRSREFQGIYKELKENLRLLLGLPGGYHIVFCSSATEIWERIVQSLVTERSTHLIEGAFAEKFRMYAEVLGIKTKKIEIDRDIPMETSQLDIDESTELIAITQNETSTGSQFPLRNIYELRDLFQDPLIAMDVVSTAPYADINYEYVDCAYFSVQKCFGLPPGLGVWLVNERCIDKARKRLEHGYIIGGYHTLTRLIDFEEKNQTPETPNTINIYLLGKIVEDMLDKGIDVIRRETKYKSKLIYHMLENHDQLQPSVALKQHRSDTVIVANCSNPSGWINELLKLDIILGSGYGVGKDNQIRIANFPTHSKELFERIVDVIEKTEVPSS